MPNIKKIKSLNIALLHYSCPPIVGGVEEVIRQQALLFQRYYHKVKIFTGAGGQFSKEYPVEVNPLLSSCNRKILRAHKVARENFKKVEALAGQIQSYLMEVLDGFDLLIAHNVLTMRFNLPLTYALFNLAEDGFLPVISWNHDSPYFYPDCPDYLYAPPWNILKGSHSKMFYVVISESRKAQFEKLYNDGEHIYVVPNGIDPIDFFGLDPVTVRLIQEQNFFEGDFLVVQPSRLHPRKNIELSIRVTRALRDRGLRARLLVTGAYDPHEPKTGEYYQKLIALARELEMEKHVLITAEYTFRSGQQLTAGQFTIRDMYLIADILFLPSRQEGFGLPLLEAGMIKLPVVCSDIPPFKEVGGEDVCFFGLEESPQEIAEKIVNFVSGLKPQRLFRRVIRNNVWDNIYYSKLLPVLQEVLEEHRRRKKGGVANG